MSVRFGLLAATLVGLWAGWPAEGLPPVPGVTWFGAPLLQAAVPPLDCPDAQTLCLKADNTGGIDLKNGTAFMEGNVVGYLREDDIRFSSESLSAFRNEAGEWAKLVLERSVHVEQSGRQADANRGIFEDNDIKLYGNVRIKDDRMVATAGEAHLTRDSGRGVFIATKTDAVKIRFVARAAAAPPGEATAAQISQAPPLPDTFLITANRVEFDNSRRNARLQGAARVRRIEREWILTGQDIYLVFKENRELDYFNAQGGVVLKQPGRVASADTAVSRNNNETILLVGNARVKQEGRFDLSSERIEMYTSVNKGLVKSDESQQPLTLNLNVGKKSAYRLDTVDLEQLSSQGLPVETRTKLLPLVGRIFDSDSEFEQDVNKRLTQGERELFLTAILNAAKQR